MSTLAHIADVMLVERRRCKCGTIFHTPSTRVHRLLRSHKGALLPITQCRSRVEFSNAAGRNADPCVDLRTFRIVDVYVAACLSCWRPNISWDEARAITPDPPPPAPSDYSIEARIAAHARGLNRTFAADVTPSRERKVASGGKRPSRVVTPIATMDL